MVKMQTLTLTATLLALSSQAAELTEPNPLRRPGAASAAIAPVRGGLYEVQPQLKLVDASSTSAPVLARLGSKAVVQASDANPSTVAGLTAGTVVRNRLSGELGYYSGHLLVLLKDRQQLEALKSRFGLEVVNPGSDSGLVLLKAAPGADLQALKAGIVATGWAREVRLDLVEKRYTPH